MPCRGDDDQPIVRLSHVSKSFGNLKVLHDLTLDVEQGKTTVILGPSGTGKSVLLKHIVGLLRPDQGGVYFRGGCVNDLSARQLVEMRKQIGFLFQMGALFDSMTVQQNIEFPLIEHTKLDRTQREQRVARVLGMVGLDGTQKMFPAALSGGQRKRAALARAIVLEPCLVLYDEPTTGLDPIRAGVINELILELGKRLGITSIAVTHDMQSANHIADRLVLLYDGQIVCDADPKAFHQSNSDLVQRFIHGQADAADLELIHRGFESSQSDLDPPVGTSDHG